MFSWKEFERIQNILNQGVGLNYRHQAHQHHVDLRPKNFLRFVELLRDDLGFFVLTDITGIQGELVYFFMSMGSHQQINVHLLFDDGEIVPSITPYFAHADWMERELSEELLVRFDRAVTPLIRSGSEVVREFPPLRYNPNKSEAPYPEESYVWEHVGLLDPRGLGLFEWNVCFDPNRVVNSTVDIGFFHRGLESQWQSKDWSQVMQLVDLLQPGASPSYSIAWAKNIEDIFRIKIPERAQAIRIILLELARIIEHLTVMHEVASALSFEEATLLLDVREKVQELLEKYGGARTALGFIRIGGVREDLPHGWTIEFQSVQSLVTKNLPVIVRALTERTRFRESLQYDGADAQTILKWAVTGPAMRAAGVNFDLRKSRPFYFYQDIDFDIPVGIHGTSYDRFLIRFEEVMQSLRIITQVVDNLPLGASLVLELPEQEFKTPREWHYSCLESPNGEAGFIHLKNQETGSKRIKVKTPSFNLALALPELTLGLPKELLKPSLLSLGIRSVELDR